MLQLNIEKLPVDLISDREQTHLLNCFFTLLVNVRGNKISIQNIFILLLEHEELRNIIKHILSMDTDLELMQVMVNYDPLISRSKYITRCMNKNNLKLS